MSTPTYGFKYLILQLLSSYVRNILFSLLHHTQRNPIVPLHLHHVLSIALACVGEHSGPIPDPLFMHTHHKSNQIEERTALRNVRNVTTAT